MNVRQVVGGVLMGMACAVTTVSVPRAAAAETFTGTATVKTAGGATATAPVTVTVDRTMAQPEADKLSAAFKTGGAAGLRKALTGVAPTGSVQVGGAKARARIAIERATDKGRLITVVTDTAILHLGAGLPDAAKKEGYDFAVIDLEIPASGSGSGMLTPAARLAIKGGAFVVEGYSSEPLRLTSVTAKK